jgi:acyl carrier protein phosphodiesterase
VNYLAHLYLARHSDEAMLGALLGDFVGGRDLAAWPRAIALEIRLHRQVDSYTDAHPVVLELKSHFPQGLRRFCGIALDVYFDHLLARDWSRHSSRPLSEFSEQAYRVLLSHLPRLPARLQRLAPLMAAGDWLGSYRQRDTVDRAVERIATRLSRGHEALVACLPVLRQHEREAEAAFEAFFPQLLEFSEQQRRRLQQAPAQRG